MATLINSGSLLDGDPKNPAKPHISQALRFPHRFPIKSLRGLDTAFSLIREPAQLCNPKAGSISRRQDLAERYLTYLPNPDSDPVRPSHGQSVSGKTIVALFAL